MRGHGSWVLAAAAFLVVGLTGCSSGQVNPNASASAATTGGTVSVAPGYATPEDAVYGFIQADFSGNVQVACSYVVPAVQSICRKTKITPPTGHLSVVGEVTSGNQALVEVTGHFCQPGSGCQTNTNPSIGMPGGSLSFKQAYNDSFTGGGLSPVPCVKINGKWYVNGGG
jgi:hypothetical protein